jgi:hypothetical protein
VASISAIREPDWRRLYLLQHPLAVTMALSSVIGSLALALDPALLDRTTLGSALPDAYKFLWLAFYGIGGAISLAGYVFLVSRLEAPGLVLQATCYAVYAVSNATALGLTITGGLAVGMGARALIILTRPEVRPWESRH